MTPAQAVFLVPLPITVIALTARTALRCCTLLIALLVTVRGASQEHRINAFLALANALSPARVGTTAGRTRQMADDRSESAHTLSRAPSEESVGRDSSPQS